MYPVILVVWLLSYPTMPAFIVNTYETEFDCDAAKEHTQENYPLLKLRLECQIES